MDLIKAIFGSALPVTNGLPVIKQNRYSQSLYETGKHHKTGYNKAVPIMHSNYRRLERNKYAPWGRGDLCGLPAITQPIPATNY